MDKKLQKNILFWIGIVIVIVLVTANVAWVISDGSSTSVAPDIFRDPIVFAIIGAVLTFLLIDRWKRLEDEISEIRQNQHTVLSDVRKEAESLVKAQIEGAMRQAQAIDSKVSSLVEDHPWIADITENEFIPDASSCRIVLRTLEGLLTQGKVALAYEYLFSWTKRNANQPRLEGTVEDFLDLAEFSERVLADEYLGLLILQQGYLSASNRILIMPDYLKRLIRHGDFRGSESVAKQVEILVSPNWLQRIKTYVRNQPEYHRAIFTMRAYSSLSLYKALIGDLRASQKYLDSAKTLAKSMHAEQEITCIEAELMLINGEYNSSDEMLRGLSLDEESSDHIVFDALRLFRVLGDVEISMRLNERFSISNFIEKMVYIDQMKNIIRKSKEDLLAVAPIIKEEINTLNGMAQPENLIQQKLVQEIIEEKSESNGKNI